MTASAVASAPASASATRRRALLTPRRSNILLLLLGAILLPTMTYRAMPLLPKAIPLDLAEAAAVAIGALSLNLLSGYCGQISVGQGALLAAGSFAGGLVTSGAGLPMWVGLPAAAAASAVIALIIGFPALRLRGLYLAVVTITFAFVMYNSALQQRILTGGSAGVVLPRRVWDGFTIPQQSDMLAAALVVLLVAWLIDANVTRTKLGRAFHAIRESESVAGSFGIDVARYKLLAFVLSGAFAGLSGALFGFAVGSVNSETFYLPVDYSLLLLIVVVVGGLGSRAGAVIAAFVFFMFQFLVQLIFGSGSPIYGIMPVIGAALLMYTVARHPGGFAGLIRERKERRRHGVSADGAEDVPVPALPAIPRIASDVRAPAEDTVPVLEVAHVTVRFGGLTAVDDASLTVRRGQIVGLIGPNGAGKTTLFNSISGLIRPESGDVRLQGRDVSRMPAHVRAALGLTRTFQQIGLAKDQTVLDNLLLAQHLLTTYNPLTSLLYTRRVAASEEALTERAALAMRCLGFEGREQTPVRMLSGGQQRIVEVGCALLADPALLMLDEPSAGMAPVVVESLASRLRDLRDEQGRTVLLIEHNVPLVLDVCDYVYVLNFGRVLAEGTPGYILEHPDVVSAYLGEKAA